MKRFFIFTLALIFVLVGAFIIVLQYLPTHQTGVTTTIPTPTATPIPEPPQVHSVETVAGRYAYSFFKVNDPESLSLIPNFTRPKDSSTLITDNSCKYAVNGGFYDKQNKPLGYFETDQKRIGVKLDSDLVNGFVWGDASGAAVISSDLPRVKFRFALQTGPMLIFSGQTLPLTIHNDTHARRMAVAKNTGNNLFFFTVYSEDSVYGGPLLSELPNVIQSISEQEKLGIADVINLDGGSASAFYNNDTTLTELTPVGSLFCLR